MIIETSEEFQTAWPPYKGAAVMATVKNSPYNEKLWEKIEEFTLKSRSRYTTATIKLLPAIEASRKAYKACGKDPSRYRVSSEALYRRILRGMELYRINTLVDLINLASLYCGHSINGFDRDKIQGEKLVLGIGKAGEPYEGIGKGELNIEGLPVYRDRQSAVGSTTSDSNRTSITADTTHLLATINAFSGEYQLEDAVNYLTGLLKEFAAAEEIEIIYF